MELREEVLVLRVKILLLMDNVFLLTELEKGLGNKNQTPIDLICVCSHICEVLRKIHSSQGSLQKRLVGELDTMTAVSPAISRCGVDLSAHLSLLSPQA